MKLVASVFRVVALVVTCAFGSLSNPAFAAADRQEAEPASSNGEDGSDPARDAWVLPDLMGGIYQGQCAVCHGAELQGAAQGPALVGSPLAGGETVAEVTASIATGAPDKGMPAWSGALPDDDIRGLAIYLLEKRVLDPDAARRGTGEPPVIPTAPIASEHHRFVLTSLYTGIRDPYSIAPLPDGRILVTEKMTGIHIVAADGSGATPVTGTPRFYADGALRGDTLSGSGWAHEVALHPDYADNGWIYLSYGDRCTGCNTHSRETGLPVTMLKLVRGRLVGSVWTDQQTLWEAPKETYQPGMENGAGARIAFDREGHVYLSIGAFTDYRGIQDLSKPYGKVIRVHADGGVPEDNPFRHTPGALPGIFTLGHRNPQGLDFDPHTGLLWSSEHGPRGGDEGNILRAGRNYGWPLVSLGVDYDGRPIPYAEKYRLEFDPDDLEPPAIDWTPSPGVSSIVFYRGQAFRKWQNHLLVATLGGNDLWRVEVDATGARHTETLIDGLGRLRDIEIGAEGEILLLLEHASGSQILAMKPAPAAAAD